MPYIVPCPCGASVTVELFQAGAEVLCPSCRRGLAVPSSIALQELAQERHPHFSAPDKVRAAMQEQATPFDGQCQQCRERRAENERLVQFRFLTNRTVYGDEGPKLTARGIALSVGDAEEVWETLDFPLLFCSSCDSTFEREWRSSVWKRSTLNLILSIAIAPVVLVTILLLVAMPFIGAGGLILVLVMWRNYQLRKRIDPYLDKTLKSIPLVSDAIAREDEYQLIVDRSSHSWMSSSTIKDVP